MPLSRHRRLARTASLGVAGLLLAGLPMLAPPSAQAAASCLSEAPTGGFGGLGQTRCDDDTAPTTDLGTSSPAIVDGTLNATGVQMRFTGAYTDADTGTLGFECQLYTGSTAPDAWQACTSPQTYPGLTQGARYTFRVRAVDLSDRAIDATSAPGLLGTGAATDVPDVDATPATTTFRVAAAAASTCTSEAAGPFQTRCDDVTPPQTAITATSPKVNRGYVKATSVDVSFAGSHTDGDTDPLAYECQVYSGSTPPATWQACTSPQRVGNLKEGTRYVFRARAIDAADNAIDATSAPPFGAGASTDKADVDQTPATQVIIPDLTAPTTRISGLPVDFSTPKEPVVTTDSPILTLDSNERAVTYRCTIDGKAYPCRDGRTRFRDIPPGPAVLKVTAVDFAGNADATPASVRFFVPRDLTAARGSGWSTVKAVGYVDGDYLSTKRAGATLKATARNNRELRIIAPIGPGYGSLSVTVAGEQYLLNLNFSQANRHAVFVLRDSRAKPVSGTVVIRTVDSKRVLVDGIVLR